MELITRKESISNGGKRYFTGKKCKHGHVAERFCASGRCSECDRVLQSSSVYREKRRAYESSDEMRAKRSVYNKTPKRKKRLSEMQKESYNKNKPAFLMRLLISRYPKKIRDGLVGCSSSEKLGYSLLDFKSHIEKQFVDGMSWDNHGEWHIDHIKPVSAFVGGEESAINKLSNLQPLWAKDNLSKGDRYFGN